MPSVCPILVRVSADTVFLSCFRNGIDRRPADSNGRSVGRKRFRNCANCANRMPSIVFDAHTLCFGCRVKVCDMSFHCDEYRDWSDSYRLAFVNNRTLRLSVI